MVDGLIGRKLGMTQVFTEAGEVVPVTVLEAGPNVVTQLKTVESDGYAAVQLGFGEAKRLNRPAKGHLKQLPALRYLREFKTSDVADHKLGDKIDAGIFNEGDLVDVSGVSKGKGFAGVVKRYHFAGGPKTHGQSDRHRAPGSVGAVDASRVFRGLRMAGRMGNERVTIHNLKVVRVDLERNLLMVEGAVPGPTGGVVMMRKARKTK
jgi:large subunit ribosomal protein L3